MGFATTRIKALPKWLRGPAMEAYSQALGDAFDDELRVFKFAIKQRFPTLCEEDAIDQVASAFRLERFVGETRDAFRVRVLDAWITWRKAGRRIAIIEQLNKLGIVDVQVYGNRV